MRKTCKKCPFRKDSIKGELGSFSVEETIVVASSESNFLCHLTRESNIEKQCIGRLLRATKTGKIFKRWDLERLRVEQKDSEEVNNILGFDFTEHHTFYTIEKLNAMLIDWEVDDKFVIITFQERGSKSNIPYMAYSIHFKLLSEKTGFYLLTNDTCSNKEDVVEFLNNKGLERYNIIKTRLDDEKLR